MMDCWHFLYVWADDNMWLTLAYTHTHTHTHTKDWCLIRGVLSKPSCLQHNNIYIGFEQSLTCSSALLRLCSLSQWTGRRMHWKQHWKLSAICAVSPSGMLDWITTYVFLSVDIICCMSCGNGAHKRFSYVQNLFWKKQKTFFYKWNTVYIFISE